MKKTKIVVLTGAGISAESGIQTFRDANGLWEGYDKTEVASPEGFKNNPSLVLDFYNKRRQKLLTTAPNKAHQKLVDLEEQFEIVIITQNVDDLHERAGSQNIIHLHGELLKVESTENPNYILPWNNDLTLADKDPQGFQLRPHIVWFGEAVPNMDIAIAKVKEADIMLIIGTSLQVYPAASLVHYLAVDKPILYLDLKPAEIADILNPITVIHSSATEGIDQILMEIKRLDTDIKGIY